MEVFKDIPNYEGLYQVSNLGNVKSLERKVKNGCGSYRIIKERVIKPTLRGKGYLSVGLSNGVVKTCYIHQLVSEAFLNHKPNGYTLVVDHIDNNKINNNLKNLRVVSNRKNCSKDRAGSSEYTGVSWDKSYNKWVSKIYINGRQKFIGRFTKEKDASEAYQRELSLINKSN